MNDRQKIQAIGKWLAQLRDLTRAGSEPVTAEAMATYTRAIAEAFDPRVLTFALAQRIAAQSEFWPTWAKLRDEIGAEVRFQQRHQPIGDGMPPWLLDMILANCGHQPGPMLAGWLASKGATP